MTKSDYFRAACNWPGFSGRVTVADIDSEHFNVFVQWIYTDRIYTQLSDQTTVGIQSDGEVEDQEWETLIDLYIMGDRLVAPAFKDAIINSIIEKEREACRMPLAVQQVGHSETHISQLGLTITGLREHHPQLPSAPLDRRLPRLRLQRRDSGC